MSTSTYSITYLQNNTNHVPETTTTNIKQELIRYPLLIQNLVVKKLDLNQVIQKIMLFFIMELARL